MFKLRIYLIALVVWLSIFYNLEWFTAPIYISSFVYGLTAIYAFLVILYPPAHRLSIIWLFVISLVPFFVLKVIFGYQIFGSQFPLTVTEMVAIWITLFLAWQIGYGLESLRKEILRLTIGSSNIPDYSFSSAQGECYREIRRARHYNRPTALLSIVPSKESIELSMNRFLQEAQNNIIREYIIARTADLLRKSLKESDVIALRDHHFLILLPETESKHLSIVINRLQTAAKEQLGLSLKVGASTFPDDALTFETLVDSAETRMKDASDGNWIGKETVEDPDAPDAVPQSIKITDEPNVIH